MNNGPLSEKRLRDPRITDAFKPRTLRYAHLTGWGMEVPPRVMPNDAFEALVGVNDAWIFPAQGSKSGASPNRAIRRPGWRPARRRKLCAPPTVCPAT